MDSLTHTLIGAAIARALPEGTGRRALPLLVVASNLPDVDAAWAFMMGGEAVLSRRMLTHSVLGLPALAAAAAFALKPLARGLSRRAAFALSLLAVCVHSALDLLNSYGVVLLYPFDSRRFELAWVFIIDLAFWALLLSPWALSALGADARKAARGALAALAGYVLLCGAAHARAVRLLEAAEPAAAFRYVFPEPFGPGAFRGVAREGDEYRIRLLRAREGTAELKRTVTTEERRPEVAALRDSARARRIEWFFKAPVWERTEGGVRVYDLRFAPLSVERKTPFTYAFPAP